MKHKLHGTFRIIVNGRNHHFQTASCAYECAGRIFNETGIVVGVEFVPPASLYRKPRKSKLA